MFCRDNVKFRREEEYGIGEKTPHGQLVLFPHMYRGDLLAFSLGSVPCFLGYPRDVGSFVRLSERFDLFFQASQCSVKREPLLFKSFFFLFCWQRQERKTRSVLPLSLLDLAHQNRTIAIASDFHVDGAQSPVFPQKEGVLGSEIAARNRRSLATFHRTLKSQCIIAVSCFGNRAISGVRDGQIAITNRKNRCDFGALSCSTCCARMSILDASQGANIHHALWPSLRAEEYHPGLKFHIIT